MVYLPNARGGVTPDSLFEIYPWMDPIFTDLERYYDPDYIKIPMDNNPWIPVFFSILYLLLIGPGQKYMKDKTAWNVPMSVLAGWNFFLAIFSIWGMIRTVPLWIWYMYNKSIEKQVCDPPHPTWGSGGSGLASQMFCIFKIVELMDTVFLVVRKKKVIFLHWYHHLTVLLFCWIAYWTEAGMGFYFISMNNTVHAIMYTYYGFAALKSIPKSYPAYLITSVQILQMVVGIAVVVYTTKLKIYGGETYGPGECNNTEFCIGAALIIYGSYLYLFVEFMFNRFVKTKSSDKKVK